ncbi:NADH:flavin oxidoreductase [Desulfitobacterium sp. AusDCA]|uniref:NADH:flavin oxidoreductase n=1 Tax=Desulfitobacterium sp. AusDCA TaxID=3240383 RepID=UPI003DA72CB2
MFSDLKIKNLTFKNRIVLPPMALDIASEKGEVTAKLIEHYRLRSQGIGLIIVEHSYVSRNGKAHPCQLGIYDDELIKGLEHLAREIHREGTPVGIQISHAGGRALMSPCGPSGTLSKYLSRFGQKESVKGSKKLSKESLRRIVNDFAQAARRAQLAGFDFVEIHGAHGYLLNQFYSPLTNLRRDEYGGTLEKRLRFPIEVIKAVRGAIGENMPIFYRLGADDRLAGGNSIEDSIIAARLLQDAGVDCLDLSGGICGYLKNGPEGFFAYMGKAIKPILDIPVMVTGGIKTGIKANEIIADHSADLVGVGRTLLQDSEWVSKERLKMESDQHPIEAKGYLISV